MESKLKLSNILHAYTNLKTNRDDMSMFDVGKHLGYMEAGLQVYDCLETVINDDPKSKFYGTSEIKREVIKNGKWWKSDKLESMEQAIIRQTESMFIKNDIRF